MPSLRNIIAKDLFFDNFSIVCPLFRNRFQVGLILLNGVGVTSQIYNFKRLFKLTSPSKTADYMRQQVLIGLSDPVKTFFFFVTHYNIISSTPKL